MAGVGPVNSHGVRGAANGDNGDEGTVETGRHGERHGPSQQGSFMPGGRPPPTRQAGHDTQSAFRHPRTVGAASTRPPGPSYEELAQRSYSHATLEHLVSLAGESNRPTAARVLDSNRKWLERRDYRAIDIQWLTPRADFEEIINAMREHDQALRDAGFSSTGIADAARHAAGAGSIKALARYQGQLIGELKYTPAQLSRYAFIYGPELIELLARCPALTIKNGGALGISELISKLDDGTSGRMLGELYARASALSEESHEPPPLP